MDKYMKLMAVKGLIMSMDEQLYQRFQKDGDEEKISIKKIIIDKYYEAIQEQLEQSEDEKKKNLIISLHDRGIISENVKNDLLYPKHENVGDETPEHIFHIIINGRRHIIHTPEENQTIDWEKIVLLSDLAKTGKEIFTITFNYDGENFSGTGGVLEVNDSIAVVEGMQFNVCNTSKGER